MNDHQKVRADDFRLTPLVMTASFPNIQLMFVAVVRGLASVWIVGAAISSRFVGEILSDGLPDGLALLGGMVAMFWILPGLVAVVLGIFGLPSSSWLELIRQILSLFPERNWVGKGIGLIGILYKTTVFLPFPCPAAWQSVVPEWVQWFLFREPEMLYPPPMAAVNGKQLNDEEYWIFINGITTTRSIGKSNVQRLTELFGRPIWFCHNPTDGLFMDLLECIVGKIGLLRNIWLPRPEQVLATALQGALRGVADGRYTKIVLLAHSQGTIITAQVLQKMIAAANNNKTLMRQHLEVYCFANCSQQMSASNVKVLENLTNTNDTVGWLGVLFPFPAFWKDIHGRGIVIEGTRVTEPALWGHLLNTHYLGPFWEQGRFAASRLHLYTVPPRSLEVATTLQLQQRKRAAAVITP